MRRVVVTGLGAVTPLGVGQCHNMKPTLFAFHRPLNSISGIRRTWKNLIQGHCGIKSTTYLHEDFAGLPSQVAGLVPIEGKEGWKAVDWLTKEVWFSMTKEKDLERASDLMD